VFTAIEIKINYTLSCLIIINYVSFGVPYSSTQYDALIDYGQPIYNYRYVIIITCCEGLQAIYEDDNLFNLLIFW
jgi:hypothetical protein